jgi:predicted transposase/invertase (TIGR01784 family)
MEEEIEMLAAKTEEVKMTVGRLKQLSADERTRMIFEARQLYLMDEAARRAAAVAEGEARGEARGELKMVKRMLSSGLDIATVSQISDMSEAEIKNLK